jgi:hypothetical protein
MEEKPKQEKTPCKPEEGHHSGHHGHHGHEDICNHPNMPKMSGEELTLLAASLAAALAQGKNSCELQTLINFFSMVNQNLVIILAQKRCNNIKLVDIIP